MDRFRSVMIPIIIAAGFAGACATSEEREVRTPGATPRTTTTTPATPATPPPTTVQPSDPLQACMASIPKDATAGQRAMAEQSCRRDFASGQAGSLAPNDFLQACLNRIPKDATAGQRMVAEQGCRREVGQ
jgi:hypothetical protein